MLFLQDDAWDKLVEEYTSLDLIHGALSEKDSSRDFPSKIHDFSAFPKPQSTLDLHGFTAGEAQKSAESFLSHAFHQHLRTLRLIVGKGLHSKQQQSVLPGLIEGWLVSLRRQHKILGYKWEKGGGAVLVYLP